MVTVRAIFKGAQALKRERSMLKDGTSSSQLLHIRKSVSTDCDSLASRLRKEDAAEVMAASGRSPLDSLQDAYEQSLECFTALSNGQPLVMFGVTRVPGIPHSVGSVWMLCAEIPPRQSIEILKKTQIYLDRFHKRFPILANLVDARNWMHIRWIKLMGFSVLRLHPALGYESRPFYEFAKLSLLPR